MNIILRELKANRKALIIWCVAMVLFVLSGMGKYTAYTTGSNQDVFNQMPHTLKALFGFADFDVTTVDGFYAFLFTYISITLAIHAVLLGCGILSKEERDKTTEFLMTKPISRGYILTAKYIAAIINLLLVNLVTLLSSISMVGYYSDGKDISGLILLFMVSMFLIQLIFMSLGALLASAVKKPKVSSSVATSVLLISYFISKITDLTGKVNVLNIFSPFKYFNYQELLNNKGLNPLIIVLTLALTAAFIVFSYRLYEKRDLAI